MMDHESFEALRNPIKRMIELYNFLQLGRYHQIFFFSFLRNKFRLTTTAEHRVHVRCAALTQNTHAHHTHVAAFGYCAWKGIIASNGIAYAQIFLKTISGLFACWSPEHTKLVGARAKGALLCSCCTGGPTTATIIYYSRANTIHRRRRCCVVKSAAAAASDLRDV